MPRRLRRRQRVS